MGDGARGENAIQRNMAGTGVGRDDQFGHGLIRPAEALKGLGLNR